MANYGALKGMADIAFLESLQTSPLLNRVGGPPTVQTVNHVAIEIVARNGGNPPSAYYRHLVWQVGCCSCMFGALIGSLVTALYFTAPN